MIRKSSSLLAALLVLGCVQSVPNLDSPGNTIVCFGDSITAGIGASRKDAYPNQLANRLGTEVINAGVPGETSSEALLRLEEVLAHDPWLVIVELGGNDLLQRRPIGETEASMREIVEGLLAARVLPLLVEIDSPIGDTYADLFERLEADYDVPLLADVLPDILTTPRLKADPIHPNAAGYRRLADELAEVIEPWLETRGAGR